MSMHESRKLSEDLESLRRQLAQLQSLALESAQRTPAADSPAPAEASALPAAIEQRLGCFPPFMRAAEAAPDVLQALWHTTVVFYLDNPIPELTKERLFARLSLECGVSYAAALHSCRLRELGVPTRTIRAWLEHPAAASGSELERAVQLLPLNSRLTDWPEPGSEADNGLAACAIAIFASEPAAPECRQRLEDALGAEKFGRLLAFLAYVRTSLFWMASAAQPSFDADPIISKHWPRLLEDDPDLKKLLAPRVDSAPSTPLDAAGAAEERVGKPDQFGYREFFENARDLFLVHDGEGNLLQANPAAELAMGYSIAERPDLNLFEMLAPEAAATAGSDVQRLLAGEALGPREWELVSRQGQKTLLEFHTTVLREGPSPVLQSVAREVTARGKVSFSKRERELDARAVELEQRSREMDMLSEMVDMLRACVTHDEVTMVAARVAQDVFPGQSGSIYMIPPSRELAEAAAMWGNPASAPGFSLDECWSLRRGRPHWVGDPQLGLLCKHVTERLPQSYLCVPMMAQLQAIGVLHLSCSDRRMLSESRRRLAATMAQHISMALSNLRLHEKLLSQSIRDPLTGLFNRQFLEEALQLELSRATRSRQSVGVILLELDGLEALSNANGREARESAIRELGRLVQTGVRKEDIASRFDADKFAVVLPQGSSEVTRGRAEALGESIRNSEIKHRSQSLGHITASAGIAVFPGHGRTVEALFSASESALQLAKEQGGNRVRVID